MIHGIGLSGLVSILVLSSTLQPATPPRTDDPHTDPDTSTSTSEGCEGVVDYVDELFATLDAHPAFGGFWVAPDYDGIQQMDRSDIEEIVDDGAALIEDLDAMSVPTPYAAGHDGLTQLFKADIDYVAFLGIDASTVPNFDQRERALALVLRGELTVAKACPEELSEVGDYVFYSPEDLETVFD